MKRAALVAAVVLAIAIPLYALYYPGFDPRSVTVAVGQTVFVRVYAIPSLGIPISEFHWTFGSSQPGIASVEGTLSSGQGGSSMIAVTGVAPGEAWITWSGSKQVPIFVVCDTEPPIRPVVAKIDATYAKPVTLALESPILPRAALMWYAGRVGDTSRRITSGGRSIQYTPAALGTEYVWAEAWTPCSHSTAEFRIDVTVPRRRAARFPR